MIGSALAVTSPVCTGSARFMVVPGITLLWRSDSVVFHSTNRGSVMMKKICPAGSALSILWSAWGVAHASIFEVDFGVNFSSFGNGGLLTGSFGVNTSAAPVQHVIAGGLPLTGYLDPAIPNFSATLLGPFPAVNFDKLNIVDAEHGPDLTSAAVWFTGDLAMHTPLGMNLFIEQSTQQYDARSGFGEINCDLTCKYSPFSIYDYMNNLTGNLITGGGPGFISVTQLSGGVPEPSIWTMLIPGVATIGFALRRRRQGVVFAA